MSFFRSVPASTVSALRWLIVGALAGMLLAAAAGPGFGPSSTLAADPTTGTTTHTISVSGTGRVMLTPDTADLSLGVNVTKPTATEARAAAAEAMTGVVAAIKQAGVPDKDIQTSTLSLQPVYDYSSTGKGQLTGFQAINVVSVTTHDLANVGALVDAAVAGGATSVSGISFRVQDQTAAEAQARAAAVADARAKANELASAASVSITGVVSLTETSSPTPVPVYAEAPRAADASTPVQVGTTQVTVTVAAVFEIN